MKRGLAIVVTLLVAGFLFYELRQSRQDALNRHAIERMFSNGNTRGDPGTRPPAADDSPAAARRRAAEGRQ